MIIPSLEMLARIPLLDWYGTEFLLFYIVALIVIGLWTIRRARRSLHCYDNSHEHALLTDPFEVAYLSAGPDRVTQLAISRLIHRKLVLWQSGFWKSSLIANQGRTGVPSDLLEPERVLLGRIQAFGAKGMPVKGAPAVVFPTLRPIEVRLALLGLRPTEEERKSATTTTILPLLLLVLLGAAKVGIGFMSDKPVLFLVLLLVLTVIVMMSMPGLVPRLTPSGERMLDKMRLKNETARHGARVDDLAEMGMFSHSVALFGPVAVAMLPGFGAIHQEIERLKAQAVTTAASGCSSGGVSSGCGGGGCGSSGSSGSGGGSGCGSSGCGGCGGGD
ncbi:MAG: TIGR04222 domain-containing membrane protein [Akkermansiaceae bacterium]|jgi:uncharacterized protein (TIGR04222 family)|nr:TIGR04222 domain-containing membrane protein [Akkermansiaceae bacterium]